MTWKVKAVIALMLAIAGYSVHWAAGFPSHTWLRFAVYLAAVLLCSGMKMPMPSGDGTLSVNFPFILLGIVELAPGQALILAAVSVFAQCRIRVVKTFTFVQIAFNVANAICATALACYSFDLFIRHGVEMAPALCIAVTLYFFANTMPLALVLGWSSQDRPFRLWRREFPWYLPFYLVGAVMAAAAHLTSHRFGLTTSLLLVPVIYTIYRAYRSQSTMVQDRQRHLEETEALHLRTIEGLAMAIEAKDQNTHDHLLRVRVYAADIAEVMNLDKLQTQALLTAAFLHDIGKLAVPEHIVNKPGKLTHEEFEKMKIHPVVGADILERMRFPYPVAPVVRSHHEAWDGMGYPDGLKGEEIPIGARILTVVDCFDALASDRPYRKAMSVEDAMSLIKSKAGTQFDPAVVDVLVRRYVDMEERARTQKGAIAPLDTASLVWRGTAPGAGYQEENLTPQDRSNDKGDDKGDRPPPAEILPIDSRDEARLGSLKLIAAASQEAQMLFEMGQMLGSSLSPNETISVMSSRLKRLIPFDCFAVYLKLDDLLTMQYVDGSSARCFSKTLIRLGEGLSGWVAQSGRPMLNGNAKVEPNYEASRETSTPLHSALSLPLFDLNGQIFGVLTAYATKADAFSRDHLRILQAVEAKFALSLQNALRFSSAEKDATIDFVTQLPNMRQFFLGMDVQLDRARRTGEGLCVVVCDLNSFKAVNDLHGHLTGNALLKTIADGFRKVCRSYDIVARMGGDEFVFLLPGVDQYICLSQLEAISEVVKKACRDGKLQVDVSVSVGAAFFPEDGSTAEDLLGLADRRMYLQKRMHYEVSSKTHTDIQAVARGASAAA